MSRIYQDSALRSKPLHSQRLPGAWDPPALQGGRGVILEGELLDVSRHLILDAAGRKVRGYKWWGGGIQNRPGREAVRRGP
uniref:Arpin n=1 Tax=Sphenodon punctatus TaxID=8508 RepID=A0A8D0GFL7_SPHPU